MTWRIWLSSIAATALVACGGGGGGGGSGGGALTITATPSVLVANGVNASIIHVDGSQKGPIVVRTDRGHFLETGGLNASNNTTPFDVTLVTCDSQVVAGCAGNALVNASDQNLATGRIQVRFVQVEICTNGVDDDGDGLVDCADPDCAAKACGLNGRICSAASPSACECPSGQTHELPAQCSAAVPVDNDCDGKAGCADTDCSGQSCATGTVVNSNPLFGTCKTGGACTCVSTQGTKETSCGDGIDNDCDGLIDCADPDCQSVGGLPGQFCDSTHPGLTCSNPAATGGTSTCSVCAPNRNFALAQPTETTCNDGIDNDCDGQIDCGDSDCVDRAAVCGANNERCTAALQCRCPDTSGVETICDDGQDNDCDGKKDCADSNCAGMTCGPNGKTCAGTACTCSGNGGVAQPAKETSCGDGFDNDCDGLVDCADPDCRPTVAGTFGQVCATATLVANAKCDYFGACACPGGQSHETSCGDGVDNDCDGLIDCADPDCSGQTCGTFGKTCPVVGGACSCPTGTAEVCSDGLDNNCDGKIDCDDPACANQACRVGAPSYQCRLSGTSYFCKDTSQYVLTVAAGATKVPADGIATTPVTAYLQDNTLPAPGAVGGATINFSTAPLGSVAPASGVTDVAGALMGKTSVTFTAPLTAGAAVVTASYAYGNGLSVSGTVTITAPLLSQISLSSQQYTVLGARDSGYQESSELTFALLDSNNLPYPAGLTVNFEHAPLGGSYVGPTPSCVTIPVPLCTASGVTDSTGKVKVILHSGRTAGVVSVLAKAQAGGSGLKTFTAGNIAIVAAKASGSQITLNCSPRNVPALIDQDCTNSNYAGTSDASPKCTVTLADRYGQALGVATVATFESEAGIVVGSPATTPAFPTAPQGVASAFVKVTGGKLPANVAPWTQAGEHSLTHNWDGCPSREHNPRDGLVTVIVKVRGEEGFVDGSNGCPRDGVYQGPGSGVAGCAASGENFIDLGEPFVDSNDNGQWDPGEAYDDVNNDGQWNGPNHTWDADTTIWAQARILYTDYVASVVVPPASLPSTQYASRFYTAQVPPQATSTVQFTGVAAVVPAQPGPPPVPAIPATSQNVPLYFTDTNFNIPNSKYTYAVTKSAAAKLTVAFVSGGIPTTIDSLGMNFTQLYCSSQTPADPSVDCSNQCLWAPCYPVVDVSNFAHGAWGGVIITGGATPDGYVCVGVNGSLTTTAGSISTTVVTPIEICGYSN